jgi:hypothetical protein
MVYRI